MHSFTQGERKEAVAPAIISAWQANVKYGDKTAIAILYGFPLEEVMAAFDGNAVAELVSAINKYFGLA